MFAHELMLMSTTFGFDLVCVDAVLLMLVSPASWIRGNRLTAWLASEEWAKCIGVGPLRYIHSNSLKQTNAKFAGLEALCGDYFVDLV